MRSIYRLWWLSLAFTTGCGSSVNTDQPDEPAGLDLATVALGEPVELPPRGRPQVDATIAPYEIKADLSNVENLREFRFTAAQRTSLAKNHMLIYDEHVANPLLVYAETPVPFVTSDILLHVLHNLSTETLKRVERLLLMPAVVTFVKQTTLATEKLLADSKGPHHPALSKNLVVFGVASELLGIRSSLPADVRAEVSRVVQAIQDEESFQFGKASMDGSWFRPRDPAPENIEPKWFFEDEKQWQAESSFARQRANYHRALVWFKRAGWDLNEPAELRGIALLAQVLRDNPDAQKALEIFERALSTFSERPDNLGPLDVLDVARKLLPPDFSAAELSEEQLDTLRNELIGGDPARIASRIALIGDEYHAVFALPGRYNLAGDVFQRVLDELQSIPSGMDYASAVVRSPLARELSSVEERSESIAELASALDRRTEDEWFASLTGGIHYALRALVQPAPNEYPLFMQTEAWREKSLNATLGAFVQLSDLMFLYDKNAISYVDGAGETETFYGYVEPNPEFLSRLNHCVAAHRRRLDRFSSSKELYDRERYARFEKLLDRLTEMARKELESIAFTQDEQEVLIGIGEELRWLCYDTSNVPDTREKSLICEVATEYLSQKCLRVATGRPFVVVVIVPKGDHLYLAKGTLTSYYEFEAPLTERMTNAEWLAKEKHARDSWLGKQGLISDPVREVH